MSEDLCYTVMVVPVMCQSVVVLLQWNCNWHQVSLLGRNQDDFIFGQLLGEVWFGLDSDLSFCTARKASRSSSRLLVVQHADVRGTGASPYIILTCPEVSQVQLLRSSWMFCQGRYSVSQVIGIFRSLVFWPNFLL